MESSVWEKICLVNVLAVNLISISIFLTLYKDGIVVMSLD